MFPMGGLGWRGRAPAVVCVCVYVFVCVFVCVCVCVCVRACVHGSMSPPLPASSLPLRSTHAPPRPTPPTPQIELVKKHGVNCPPPQTPARLLDKLVGWHRQWAAGGSVCPGRSLVGGAHWGGRMCGTGVARNKGVHGVVGPVGQRSTL